MPGRGLTMSRYNSERPKGSAIPPPDPVTGLRPFIWSDESEPHYFRRKALLAKYGKEINKLMKPEPLTKYYCFVIVALILTASVVTRHWSWPAYLVALWVTGIASHSAFLAVHEVTHYLAFKSQLANEALAMFVNLAIGIPYTISFRHYHFEHHKYQGWDGVDTDVPSDFELRMLQSFPGKLFFACCQIPFYALRPMLIRMQQLTWRHAINWAVVLAFNYFWSKMWGVEAVVYIMASTFMAGTPNPISGHFISEHYVFDPYGKQETYSYYGPWNAICFNVGYHNEHHDFPALPWTALPKLRKLAPEFYDDLQQTDSWFATTVRFILDENVGIWARVKREEGAGKRKLLLPTTKDIVGRVGVDEEFSKEK